MMALLNDTPAELNQLLTELSVGLTYKRPMCKRFHLPWDKERAHCVQRSKGSYSCMAKLALSDSKASTACCTTFTRLSAAYAQAVLGHSTRRASVSRTQEEASETTQLVKMLLVS